MSKSNISPSRFVQKSFEGLQLWIIPSKEHKFLLTTSEVAKGYGIDESSIRWHKFNHKSELLENTHFISSVGLTNARGNLRVKQVYWTLQGIIRLGFYVDSPRGKKFRDWLEKLAVEKLENEIYADEKINPRLACKSSESGEKTEIQKLSGQFNDIYNMLYLLESITKNPQFDKDQQYRQGLKTAYDWFFKEFKAFKTNINNAAK